MSKRWEEREREREQFVVMPSAVQVISGTIALVVVIGLVVITSLGSNALSKSDEIVRRSMLPSLPPRPPLSPPSAPRSPPPSPLPPWHNARRVTSEPEPEPETLPCGNDDAACVAGVSSCGDGKIDASVLEPCPVLCGLAKQCA
jgi:hypothetical protein